MADKKYHLGIGRRKCAVAMVKVFSGDGKYEINGQAETLTQEIMEPLMICGLQKKFDISVKVQGGGHQGQIDAVKLGITRALIKEDPERHLILKKAGLVTRDQREKERKKYGLKRARKAPQWSKR